MSHRTQDELNPAATFEKAQSYRIAADRLFDVMRGQKLPVRDPIYSLYAHAVELALKALLLAHNFAIPTSGEKGHDIAALYKECRDAKLIGRNDLGFLKHNVIALLGSGNDRRRYRYPGKNERIRADLDWVCEGVGQVMQSVEPFVLEWVNNNSPAPPNHCIAFGKPTLTKQPVPRNPGPG